MENEFLEELKQHGYDCALAFATNAEIEAQAACGQLGLLEEELS